MVPPRFRSSPQLILEIGYRMNPPIPDLDIEGDGVRCTLSFAKQPFQCVLLWSAIWALIGKHDGRGYQWAEDMPPEIVAIPQPPPPPKMPPVKLRAIGLAPAPAPSEPVEEKEEPLTAADIERAELARALKEIEADARAADAKPEEKPEEKAGEPADARAEQAAEKADEKAPEAAEPAAKAEQAPDEATEKPPEERSGGKKKRELPSYLRVIK